LTPEPVSFMQENHFGCARSTDGQGTVESLVPRAVVGHPIALAFRQCCTHGSIGDSSLGERGVRPARKMHDCPRVPVGIRL
jgi:hypothetical protein